MIFFKSACDFFNFLIFQTYHDLLKNTEKLKNSKMITHIPTTYIQLLTM